MQEQDMGGETGGVGRRADRAGAGKKEGREAGGTETGGMEGELWVLAAGERKP
jgi:hypothetical protein